MKPKYGKKLKEIEQIEKAIDVNQKRAKEARQRLEKVEKDLEANKAPYQEAILAGDEKRIQSFESAIREAEILRNRDNLLVEGLAKELPELRKKLDELKTERDEIFAQNAKGVLQTLSQQYDAAATEALKIRKQLLVVHEHLRQRGHSDVFKTTLGAGAEYIAQAKIPVLKGFTPTAYNRGNQVAFGNVGNELLKMIEL